MSPDDEFSVICASECCRQRSQLLRTCVKKPLVVGVGVGVGVPPESQQRQPILVATCHVHWDPEFCDVKLIQTMMLMNELKNIIEETQTSLRPGSTAPDSNCIPLILCGDLNSLPESGTHA